MNVEVVATNEERTVLRERKSLGRQLRLSVDIVDGGYILNYPSPDFYQTTEVFVSTPKLKKKINEILEYFKSEE